MRTIVLSILLLTLIGCEKTDKNDFINFFNDVDRIGTWVNAEKQDTIIIINDSLFTRLISSDIIEYKYRIVDSTLHTKLVTGSGIETKRKILNIEDKKVTIDNMYIVLGIEPGKTYGIFIKVE